MKFDLLIKGGEVVDPGGGQSGRLDVAIKRNRIAAVDHDIPTDSAVLVIDAGGQYVTPGLIDLHTHGVMHSLYETGPDGLRGHGQGAPVRADRRRRRARARDLGLVGDGDRRLRELLPGAP